MLRELNENEMEIVSGGHIDRPGDPSMLSADSGPNLHELGGSDGTVAIGTHATATGVAGVLVNTNDGSGGGGFGGRSFTSGPSISFNSSIRQYLHFQGNLYYTERDWLLGIWDGINQDAASNTGINLPSGRLGIGALSNNAIRGVLNGLGVGVPSAPGG